MQLLCAHRLHIWNLNDFYLKFTQFAHVYVVANAKNRNPNGSEWKTIRLICISKSRNLIEIERVNYGANVRNEHISSAFSSLNATVIHNIKIVQSFQSIGCKSLNLKTVTETDLQHLIGEHLSIIMRQLANKHRENCTESIEKWNSKSKRRGVLNYIVIKTLNILKIEFVNLRN